MQCAVERGRLLIDRLTSLRDRPICSFVLVKLAMHPSLLKLLPIAPLFALMGLVGGCTLPPQSSVPPSPTPIAATPVALPTPTTTPAPDPEMLWQEALEQATSAANLSQAAQSIDDWKLISSQWQEAIALLRRIPQSSPRHAEAQTKIAEYQRNLEAATRQANAPIPVVPIVGSSRRSPSPEPADATATPSPGTTPSPGASPSPEGSPTPTDGSTPTASPTPGTASPLPTPSPLPSP